jgi:DNA repair exonuclease SbcCD ATPase subunit
MNKVILKYLTLDNFKGSLKVTIPFNESITKISGVNGVGKTRIFDAFTWLLFGKVTKDRTDFDIKDTANSERNRQEHIVEGQLNDIILKRIFKEKWQKERGAAEATFKGNTTDYFINGVPKTLSEYNQTVNEICDEQTFKLITNPMFFNSLKWEERRKVLFKIADCPSDTVLMEQNEQFTELVQIVTGRKLEDFKSELAAKKKPIKDELKQIPSRIDEVSKSLLPELEWKTIETDIQSKEKQISNIDLQIENANKSNDNLIKENSKIQTQINELTSKKFDIERKIKEISNIKFNEINQEIIEKQGQQKQIKSQIKELNTQIEQNEIRIKNGQAETLKLRTEWANENEKELKFNDNEFICPACNRPFETSDIEAKKTGMFTFFNTAKQKKLQDISELGKKYKSNTDKLIDENKEFDVQIRIKESAIKLIKVPEPLKQNELNFTKNEEWKKIVAEINESKSKIKTITEINNNDLKTQKFNLQSEVDGLKVQLNSKSLRDNQLERINELKRSEKTLAQSIADIEKKEFKIQEFTAFKINSISDKINSMFITCTWDLFRTLVNGNIEECCDCMVHGVSWHTNLNQGHKVKIGIEIINVISHFYNISTPIFIDNKESLTGDLDSESQMIYLIHDENQHTLKIE